MACNGLAAGVCLDDAGDVSEQRSEHDGAEHDHERRKGLLCERVWPNPRHLRQSAARVQAMAMAAEWRRSLRCTMHATCTRAHAPS